MKKTLISINPEKALDESITYGALTKTINDFSDATFVNSDGSNYDFKNNKIKTLKYFNGKFMDSGFKTPKADLWVFYSDGYSTDTSKLGYSKPIQYHESLMSFLEKQVLEGNVGKIINSPETERKTLKKYFAELDFEKYGVIPTYVFNNFDEFMEKFYEKGKLVSKPDWGGAMRGVELISSMDEALQYKNQDFGDFVFQDFYPGNEKRMWVVGSKFVDGRLIKDRDTPWETHENFNEVFHYNEDSVKENGLNLNEFYRDVSFVNKLAKKVNLEIGSIDFLGDKINEINGAGTGFTSSNRANTVRIDARKHLTDYIKSLLI